MSAAQYTSAGDLDRLPPHDLEAERSVLGSMLFDEAAIESAQLIVREEDFYADAHRRLWRQVIALWNRDHAIDVVTLAHALQASGDLESIGGVPYLNQVMEAVPHAEHADYYARIVSEHARRRRAIAVATELLRKSHDASFDVETLFVDAESALRAASEGQTQSAIAPLGNTLVKVFAQIEEGGGEGIATGFSDLDELTGGMFAGQMIVLGARPSVGKTALALSIIRNLARRGMRTLLFSMEMPGEDIAKRLLSINSGVPFTKLNHEHIDHSGHYAAQVAANDMFEYPVDIDDRSGLTVNQISAAARHTCRRSDIAAVVIDYLQLIRPERGRSRYEQITEVSVQLKSLARQIEKPLLVLTQLNREMEKRKGASRKPQAADLRDSGAIEQDADQIWLLHRESMYMESTDAGYEEEVGRAELFVRKNRNGETGRVHLQFNAPCMHFRDLAVGYSVADF